VILSVLFFFFSITCIYAGVLTFPQDQSSAAALILAGIVLLLKPLAAFLRNFGRRPPAATRAGVVDLQKYRAKGRRKPPREKREARVKPDILTWGKGMGGDMPMAGLSHRPEIEDKLREGSQPSTFAGNAVACEVSMTNIDLLTDPDMNLVGRAAQLGDELREYIKDAGLRCVGEVRGYGLMIGIELVADRRSKEPLSGDQIVGAVMGMLNRGIALFPCGRYNNVFRLMPPLVLPPRDGALLARRLRSALGVD
jgi:adenosylmethionine-8-amino-7-oxononanoate aminotransferase